MYKLFLMAILAMSVVTSSLFASSSVEPSQGMKASGAAQISEVISTEQVDVEMTAFMDSPVSLATEPEPLPAYVFGNPAGCAVSAPNQSPVEMLANVQAQLPDLD